MKKVAKGAPGYDGYEYQIETSIWIALELMLKKKISEVIYVEPENSEDVEVDLMGRKKNDSPSEQAAGKFFIQCKSKSRGLWSADEFKKVVGDGKDSKVSSRGPKPRTRALQLLLQQPDTTYYFVTNAWVESKLQNLVQEELNEELSYFAVPAEFIDSEIRDKVPLLKGRVRVIQGLSRELVGYRIERLLAVFGKVPHLKIDSCVLALIENFRGRLLGKTQPLFTLDDLNKIIYSQGGRSSAISTRAYYAPVKAEQITRQLMNDNVILIIGPPGVGKTLFAEYMAELLQQYNPPFSVFHERDSIGSIKNILSVPGPVLFIISDPWGTTPHERPTSLSHELINLLGCATPDKKFIITTRSDIYGQAPKATRSFFSEYITKLTSESYSEQSRWCIATQGLAEISGGAEIAERNKLEISRDLTTPYELSAFNLILKKEMQKYTIIVDDECSWLDHYVVKWVLDGVEVGERDKVETIIARAASETTVESTALILQGWRSYCVEHTAMCWFLLVALETTEKRRFVQSFLGAAEGSSNDLLPEEFVDFLCDAYVVGSENGLIYAHSYQLEGMTNLIRKNLKAAKSGLILATEYLLSVIDGKNFLSVSGRYINAIATWLDFYSGLTPFKNVIATIDGLFERECRRSNGLEFYEIAGLAMWWGYGQTSFMKILNIFGSSRLEPSLKWTPDFSSDDLNLVIEKKDITQYLIPKLITEYLPFTTISYCHHIDEFVEMVFQFGINLESECRLALDKIYDRLYVDYGDGVCDEPDLDLNIKPLQSLLARYSEGPYYNKFVSENTDPYNPYK